ncbi:MULTISPECIES: VVA0879 family protein [Paenibacillus]|uniref:VVA0879 family protein n=1 Tax=Paenibacillus oleatilyticus TaxID=2594886 RepID=A0ABV4UVH5_9BACL|nr:VVA0879 family protein [Paenibacillus sp. A3]KPV60752.1 hypothetical protein QJ48_04330 [Paenibacillus sp. A3]
MIKQTLAEWKKEAQDRFGEKTSEWKFRCSRCGNDQSASEFVEAGIKPEDAISMVYQECIGRHGAKEVGCDWAAFGLLGTLGKGRIVFTPDGREVEVFDFAPVEVTQ